VAVEGGCGGARPTRGGNGGERGGFGRDVGQRRGSGRQWRGHDARGRSVAARQWRAARSGRRGTTPLIGGPGRDGVWSSAAGCGARQRVEVVGVALTSGAGSTVRPIRFSNRIKFIQMDSNLPQTLTTTRHASSEEAVRVIFFQGEGKVDPISSQGTLPKAISKGTKRSTKGNKRGQSGTPSGSSLLLVAMRPTTTRRSMTLMKNMSLPLSTT
jgi:hypothetical protein